MAADWCNIGRVTVDMLPGDALLEIFDWYLIDEDDEIEAWQTLVHVCQKWRNVVFGSPHRLNLRLLCTNDRPVAKMLNIWPPLPIIIWGENTKMGEDNIVAALTHNVRVCGVTLNWVPNSLWEKVLAAMQEPFPALTHLDIHTADEEPIVSSSFLGGSASNLQCIDLSRVPFPGLPKLLSSATHLCTLHLCLIPHSGYFSPEAMATALSALTSLEKFSLWFQSPRSCPGRGRRHPPPPTRSVLPALTEFNFRGVSEYLDDLVARIDAPLLGSSRITFFPQLIYHIPRFAQFIGRTPSFMARDEAHVVFYNFQAILILPQTYGRLESEIPCRPSDWQLSMLAQVCTSSLYLISSLEHLYIHDQKRFEGFRPCWQDDIENIQWLELLHPFTTVKALYLSRGITTRIIPALEELVGESATVLPALQSLFLEELHLSGPVQEAIDKFITARRLSNHPVVVSHWDGKRAPW